MRPMPPGVKTILIVTIASFILQLGSGNGMILSFALWPMHGNFMP